MTDGASASPTEWRNFTTHVPITACRLKHDGLKRLYRILNERQKEYRDKIIVGLCRLPSESEEDFKQRRAAVYDAFVVSVAVAAESGEFLTGNREETFDDLNFPTRLRSVFYSIQSVPNAVLKHMPQNRVTLFLDFSQPPIFDFSRLPTLSTPNESNFEIAADSEAWFVTTKAKLVEFFRERRAGYDWIHRSGVYDVFLYVVGLPLAVWACVRLEAIVPALDNLNIIPRSLVYAYTFMMSLVTFRVIFSYSRWVFPKVEIESDMRRTPLRHRTAWAFVILAILSPALYDLAKEIAASVPRIVP